MFLIDKEKCVQLVLLKNYSRSCIHQNIIIFFVFFLVINIINQRKLKLDHHKIISLGPNSISTDEINVFSQHVFSTYHNREEVQNPKTVNYYNSVNSLPRKIVKSICKISVVKNKREIMRLYKIHVGKTINTRSIYDLQVHIVKYRSYNLCLEII